METDYNLTSQKIETVQLRFDFHIEKLHDYIFALVSKNWFSIVLLTSSYVFLTKREYWERQLNKESQLCWHRLKPDWRVHMFNTPGDFPVSLPQFSLTASTPVHHSRFSMWGNSVPQEGDTRLQHVYDAYFSCKCFSTLFIFSPFPPAYETKISQLLIVESVSPVSLGMNVVQSIAIIYPFHFGDKP